MLKIHPFEKAGLGKAPFQFVGVSEKVYCAYQGAPEQPAGTCDFCGNGIRYCYHIRSVDNRNFVVGCECVKRTDNECLTNLSDFDMAVREQKSKLNHLRRAKQVAKEEAGIKVAFDLYPSVRNDMAKHPHPQAKPGGWFEGKSLVCWADWMIQRAGHAGRLQVAKTIEKFARF